MVDRAITAHSVERGLAALGRRIAPLLDQRDVLVELLRIHAHRVRETIGHRAVAGEDHSPEPCRHADANVVPRMTLGMLAQRRVHVGIEEPRFSCHGSRLATTIAFLLHSAGTIAANPILPRRNRATCQI